MGTEVKIKETNQKAETSSHFHIEFFRLSKNYLCYNKFQEPMGHKRSPEKQFLSEYKIFILGKT